MFGLCFILIVLLKIPVISLSASIVAPYQPLFRACLSFFYKPVIKWPESCLKLNISYIANEMKYHSNRIKKNSIYEHVYPSRPVRHLPPDGVVCQAYLFWRTTMWSPVKVDFHAASAAHCLQALLCSPDGFFFLSGFTHITSSAGKWTEAFQTNDSGTTHYECSHGCPAVTVLILLFLH